MKKKLCFSLALVFSLAFLLPCFFAGQNTLVSHVQAISVESEYFKSDSIDLISANISSYVDNGKVENVSPYNKDTKTRYEGQSITPIAGEYGEFKNKIFQINGGNGYTPEKNDAIFMWVYLINVNTILNTFKLKIELSNGSGNNLIWSFSHQEVQSMGTGWKFIQLNLIDFEYSDEDYTNTTYDRIIFSYYSEAEDEEEDQDDVYDGYETKTSERFSFYHVFASKNVNNNFSSGMIYNLPQSYFEFSDTFNIGGTFYIGDKVKIGSVRDIFKTLYIGKYDLSNYSTNSNYYWTLSFTSPSSDTSYKDFGDYLNFYEQGYYNFTIQLHSKNETKPLLSEGINIYCDNLSLGNFVVKSKCTINDNEKVMISFKLADNVVIDGDYSLTIDNNNAVIESYYEENGVIYVCVSGVSAGSSTLDISAKIKSQYGVKAENVSSSISIDIVSTEDKMDLFEIILWIFFACFCTGIMIYWSISLVKSRKNDVK